MRDSLCIANESLNAEIARKGAELTALSTSGGRDLQWSGDPAVWKGRAPLLFPIVGELAGGHYRLDGRSYRLPRHGFARARRFPVMDAAADCARFHLSWDEETLAAYPFRFHLDLQFRIAGAT